ncbi:transporter substrate-binding domain-containing protein [Spartinivicinus poritis]|uniref:Transporter substrate-binding domain-containing protein n=1 Tax=Spartinivicinus poritis TaxID=2994640 RepID=A0ABT5UDG8_9GAMM|nr:transporter substrate-binding domain-containing protein [Spartinivicinus sp. A2-2]MDE1464425.1 transporter substrate-binding domain-containing protein [Spartinivicinus sp. A2-2]
MEAKPVENKICHWAVYHISRNSLTVLFVMKLFHAHSLATLSSMKLQKISFMLLMILFSCHIDASKLCKKPLTVSFDTHTEPWSYLDQNAQLTGLDVELIKTIFTLMGCQLIIRLDIPWKRQVHWLEQGLLDIAAQASKTSKREMFAYFSEPYRHEYIAIYIRKEDLHKFNFMTLTELPHLKFRLGIRRGNYYGDKFSQLLKTALFKKYINIAETEQDNFFKLIANRIDGFIGYPPGTEIDLKKVGLSKQIIRHPMPMINTGSIHVMFSKKTTLPALITQFNHGLQTIKTSGEFSKIIQKYNGDLIHAEH